MRGMLRVNVARAWSQGELPTDSSESLFRLHFLLSYGIGTPISKKQRTKTEGR